MRILHLTSIEKEMFDKFYKIYEENFNDPSEVETSEQLFKYINSDWPIPQPKTHLFLAMDSDSVMGAIVVEHYRSSDCILLTYIVTDSKYRKQGIARRLIQQVSEYFKDKFLEAVFIEANDPERTDASMESMNTKERLLFYKRVGAKIVDVPYAQPALGEGKEACECLLLLALPLVGQNEIDKETIREFLYEFYSACKVEDPEKDENYILSVKSMKDKVALKEIE
jgi:GNAT superfamily N-acetyltransferase